MGPYVCKPFIPEYPSEPDGRRCAGKKLERTGGFKVSSRYVYSRNAMFGEFGKLTTSSSKWRSKEKWYLFKRIQQFGAAMAAKS